MGIDAWHHPELMAEISAMSAEARLLTLIDSVLFEGQQESLSWTGKSLDLEKALKESKFGFEVEKMFKWANACGSLLARLAKIEPNRVVRRVKDGDSD